MLLWTIEIWMEKKLRKVSYIESIYYVIKKNKDDNKCWDYV